MDERVHLKSMDPLVELERLLELDELKTGSTTAISIQEVLRKFLSFQDSIKQKLVELIEQIRRSYKSCCGLKTLDNIQVGQPILPFP